MTKTPDTDKGLTAPQLFNLAFGTIVGVGWITVLGDILGQAGSLGVVLAFAAGALLVCLIGLCYGELASVYPASGGETVYALRIFGQGGAFVAGWLLAFAYLAVTAFEAISVGWILAVLIPGIEGPTLYRLFDQDIHLGTLVIGIAGTALFGWLNIRGAELAARVQSIMTYTLLALSLVFVVAGLGWGKVENLQPLFGPLGGEGFNLRGFLAVFITTPFWYAGFNVIPQALGETSRSMAAWKAGLMIIASIAGAGIFYALVFLAASMTLPRQELLALDLPAAGAFAAAFDSEAMGKLVLVSGLLGLLTTWNAVIFAGARVFLAMGQSGAISGRLAALHPRHGTPAAAIIAISGIGALLVLFGRGAILPLVNSVGVCFAMLFTMMALAFLKLRREQPDLPRPFRVRAGRLVGWLSMMLSMAMLVISLEQHWTGADGMLPLEWLLLLGWGGAGLLSWLTVGRKATAQALSR